MTGLEFVASIVKSLAWPSVVALALLLFRRPVSWLIGQIREFSFKDAKVRLFEEQAQEVRSAIVVERATSNPDRKGKIGAASYKEKIVIIWMALINGVRGKVVESQGDIGFHSLNDEGILALARLHSVITEEQFNALNGLRIMRNLAIHSPTDTFDHVRYMEFFVLAESIAHIIGVQIPDIAL